MQSDAWKAIFDKYNIFNHDFNSPFYLNAEQIKKATTHFTQTNQREVRILCKQDRREDRPDVFIENNLFILPVKNGQYAIVKGEGYVDIPEINQVNKIYNSKLDFQLDTAAIGNSEMQHLDFAYASSLIRTFLKDDSLVLTIRGRKYTPKFSFFVAEQNIDVESVQTEVDAGYEGRNQIVLIEAKSLNCSNTIIRQLFYPFKQWKQYSAKKVITLFFEKKGNSYLIWEFVFEDENNYNSIKLVDSARYEII